MQIIIMGCGRVGSSLSVMLSENGHQVTVIDHDANAITRLGIAFKGKVVHGLGFDRDVLTQARIETADAFVAASSSDNANIVAARIARNIFRVPRVVARLYDPLRAEIYQRLGLLTISSTDLGVKRIYELLTHNNLDPTQTFGRGEVSIVNIETPLSLVNRTVTNINIPGELLVVAITRTDQSFIPVSGTEIQANDLLHICVHISAMPRLEALLGL